MRRLKAIHLAPLLALIALLAWAFASPIGASPDDDHHLVSIWCSSPNELCEPGDTPTSRVVPEAAAEPNCFAQQPERSAACQEGLDLSGEPTVETDRGNFQGAYPPVFYSFMSMFAGPDIFGSAMLMRVVNALIFVGLTSALFVLLPVLRRPTLLWGWIISTLPMGIFIIASNNPSSWAVMGVGTAWIALLGYLETSGRRKWLLGGIFAIATLMAAGARGDAAMYSIIGIGVVFLLTAPFSRAERSRLDIRQYARDAILPIAVTALAAILFLTSRQTGAGITGFSPESVELGDPAAVPAEIPLAGFGQLAYNLLNVPFLWAGNFGEWGLGWLDTDMPAIVPFGAIAVFVAVGISGLARIWSRKLLVVILIVAVLWLLPVYVLWQSAATVGEAVQPRYLLPLIVLLAGVIMLTRPDSQVTFTRVQLTLITLTLSVVNFVALHMNLRRYVTGIDSQGINLDAGAEWWWDGAIFSPMFVWIIGSAAYAALIGILAIEAGNRAASVPQTKTPIRAESV